MTRQGQVRPNEQIKSTGNARLVKPVDAIAARHQPNQNDRPLIRKHAKPELDGFLNDKRETRIIIFDVETNGLNGRYSVLGCSAIKYEIDPNTHEMTEIDRFNRYYYPVEQFEPQAIAVNGLTRDVITEKRGDAAYPKHFSMDPDFETFCSDTERFVAHNISFDMQFIPFMREKKKFCTMMTNMNIVAVEFLESKNEWKWPRLSETAIHYGIPLNESGLHNSMYDTEITAKVLSKMLEAINRDDNGIKPHQDVSTVNKNQEDPDFQRFLIQAVLLSLLMGLVYKTLHI
jgi:DNA polymerase-3 subunit epsilon